MHCAVTCETLAKDCNNIIEHVSRDDYFVIRKMMVAMILSTDMAKHFDLVVHFRNSFLSKEPELTRFDERLQVLVMTMKCSDVGHAAKRNDLHVKWSMLICEEFFNQGDIEKSMGIPVSIFCDRENSELGESQSGFIGNLVLPLFEVTNEYLESDNIRISCLKQLSANYNYWKTRHRKNDSQTDLNEKKELLAAPGRDR